MSISVVIPTRNSRDYLEKTLANLMAQLILPSDEVIVIDDGSSDGLRDMLEEKYSPPVRYVRIEHDEWHLNTCRNTGIESANNPLIYMLDADCIPQPGCVEKLRANAKRGTYASGLLIYEVPLRAQKRQAKKRGGMAMTHLAVGNYPLAEVIRRVETDSSEVKGTIGSNVMYSRVDAEDVGLYDEDYNGCYGYEDTDFIIKMHFNGVEILNLKDALAYHQTHKHRKPKDKWRENCLKRNQKRLRGKIPSYRKGVFIHG